MIYENSLSLWKQLKKMGNITDGYYDKCIITDLKKALSITGSFDNAIRNIPVSEFLNCFFQVIAPISSMYIDILNFFERCNAVSSEKNIEIRLDIDAFNQTRFNAMHFVKAKEIIKKIRAFSKEVDLSASGIALFWELPRTWMNSVDLVIKNRSFNKWYDTYKSIGEICPSVNLDIVNVIKELPIAKELTDAYIFWNELSNYYKSLGITRKNLWEYALSNRNVLDILQPETDFVLGTSLGCLYYIAENYYLFSESQQDSIKDTLRKLGAYVHDFDEIAESLIQSWEDFLKLPVWEKRYELFSIWVFTVIIRDFPDELLTFNIKDKTLIFSFAGGCIASIVINETKIEFWNELQTNAITPLLGQGRKNAIKPDFSIISGNAYDANSSIVVVECKQYKKPSYKNFSEAIIDYSNNRPQAKILLVDYGDFNIKTLSSKIMISDEQYLLFNLCRPEHKIVKDLSKSVFDIVRKSVGIDFTIDDTLRITLEWGKEPLDLDLHLYFQKDYSSVINATYYSTCNIPDTEFHIDHRNGYGPEIIKISKLHKGIYNIWVNNYSGIPNLSESKAKVKVNFEKSDRCFTCECPNNINFPCWHILDIDTRNMVIDNINTFEKNMPNFIR